MNIPALKSFAPAVRRQLMEAVSRKLDYVLTAQTPDYLTTYASQVNKLSEFAREDREALIERVAYTWFNRFTALRFLDARGWHPFRVRVLTAASSEETQPEILKAVRSGILPEELKPHANTSRLNDLLDGKVPSSDPQGEVYRHLVLAACRFYNRLLPNLFERLDDETELLLPDDLLTEHSIVQGFRTEIRDEDCAEIELLGWLYQFYITEKKDAVMARKSVVPSVDIPAVTQLFTPHWIVRYLVENSLGRLWLTNRPLSRLRERMAYYVETETEEAALKISSPEDIRLLDPAVGSGHMLIYAFDLLYEIYQEEGYAPSDIPSLILTHNLHGLDICPRASQLACLALMLKAREKSRRFFQPDKVVQPRVLTFQDTRFVNNELHDYFHAIDLSDSCIQTILNLLLQFEEANTLGSLIQPCTSEADICLIQRTIEGQDISDHLFLHKTQFKILRVLELAKVLTPKYHLVLANPPYMGSGNMNGKLKYFAARLYPLTKADLFSMFIEQSKRLLIKNGYLAQITMQSWMFLSSFSKMRKEFILTSKIETCIHIGYNSFPELNSKVAQAVAFVICNTPSEDYRGKFFDLNSAPQSADKHEVFKVKLATGDFYLVSNAQFHAIPGSPLAYWVSRGILHMFSKFPVIGDKVDARQGLITANNDRFLRRWWEGTCSTILLPSDYREEACPQKKWFPYNKGGDFRKWYGNAEFIVNWENDGQAIKDFVNSNGEQLSRPQNTQYYFRESISWSDVTTDWNSFRWYPAGFIFDATGHSAFPAPEEILELLAYLNTKIIQHIAKLLNPTIHFHVGYFRILPFLPISNETVKNNARVAISMARADWNNSETSWDFCHPILIQPPYKGQSLDSNWQNYRAHCNNAIRRMRETETENNQIFIEAYGLKDELSPEVPEDQITLARADERKDMAAFLSYAVGCMMGRYSLDKPGLILANAGDTLENYLAKVDKSLDQLSFQPDGDGIIPVLDGEWFKDDIVARTREFLLATFGKETLQENIRFIEQSLGKDLRKYFLTDFYKNHISNERAYGYKKRPIYWMVQSPQKGFNALIYLHRYTRDTMNVVLNRYLRPYQEKLRGRLSQLAQAATTDSATTREKTAIRKETDKLNKILHECEEWERKTLLPLAQARIELDLDDGVKVNYQKLGEALAPIAGLAKEEEE